MRTKSIFLSLILIFAVSICTSAQVGGYLKNKVNRAVNAGARAADKVMDREVDTAVTKGVNNAAGKIEQDAQNKQAENQKEGQNEKPEGNQAGNKNAGGFNLGAILGGGPVTSKYRDSYSFNNRIYMQGEIYDGKDIVKMDYYIYFNDSSPDAGIETKMSGTNDEGNQVAMNTSFIYDGTNKSFMILTDMRGTKIGIISDVPEESAAPTDNAAKTVMTKTGNSRVIAGYKCDEYLVKETGSNEYSKVWLTKDLKLKADKRTFSKAGLSPDYDNPELRDAATLAMESYDENGKLTMKSETREINMGFSHTMSPAGFPLRQMNFNQAGTQQK